MRIVAVIVGAVIGLVAGYLLGAYAACLWLMRGSNLCGLVGVFITGPLGLVVGVSAGWWLSRQGSR